MVHAVQRSMNDSLKTGLVEGSYKMVRKDAECSTAVDASLNGTYATRESMHLPYYGIGMKRSMHLPTRPGETFTSPDYYGNKLQEANDRGIVGGSY